MRLSVGSCGIYGLGTKTERGSLLVNLVSRALGENKEQDREQGRAEYVSVHRAELQFHTNGTGLAITRNVLPVGVKW